MDQVFTPYNIPASVVLSWPPANHVDPERRRWYVPYGAVLQSFSTIFVMGRIYARFGSRGLGLNIDDFLILFAWGCAAALFGIGVHGVLDAGFDRHTWDIVTLQPPIAVQAGVVGWTTQLLFLWSLCSTKASVLFFCNRLLERSHSWVLRNCIYLGIAFNFLYLAAFTLNLILSCDPPQAAWKGMDIFWTVKYKCIDRAPGDLTNGILAIVTDVYAICIPVWMVSHLAISKARKISYSLNLGCSILVVGASIARTYYMHQLYVDARRDISWVGYNILVWGTLETQLALICASVPAINQFATKATKALQPFNPRRSKQSAGTGTATSGHDSGTTKNSLSTVGNQPAVENGVERIATNALHLRSIPSHGRLDTTWDMELFEMDDEGSGTPIEHPSEDERSLNAHHSDSNMEMVSRPSTNGSNAKIVRKTWYDSN